MEEVEAETLVKEALTRLDARIQETGAAVRIISPLPRLHVNRMWATQGLYNLLANAMKFTRDGHAPDIEIASYEAPASPTSVAGIVVKDRGPGVSTRHAEQDFHAVSTGGGTKRTKEPELASPSYVRWPSATAVDVGPATRRRRIGVRDYLRMSDSP